MLGWLVERGISPHIPVWDKGKCDDGTLSRGDFAFDAERDLYVCPPGSILKTTGRLHDGKTLLYEQIRLRSVPLEASVLSQGAGPQDPTRHQ